ncbi:complement component C8 gamma chain isoform X2 [Lagopus muta]|uniref:complement component C8 gamma chain isoform X2 n=1 Tax=Lagopus muta TaxID=64668 RepID=UPI00209E1950|nr:complement component C8 gamma chain isoform X2 [Lagopus muta]
MAAPRSLLLLSLLLAALQGRGQQPPPPRVPLEKVVTEGNLGLDELVGRWFLVGMASRCSYLAENSHRLEATAMTVAVLDGQSLAISTFRKLDGQCWEIRQRYVPAGAHGRFSVRGRGYDSKMEVVVGEADPRSYAIIYYQDGQGLSVKLYGRSSQLSDAIVDRFEQRARAMGLSEDVSYYFPTYGFCDSADDFHILDGEHGSTLPQPCLAVLPQHGQESLGALVWGWEMAEHHPAQPLPCLAPVWVRLGLAVSVPG